MKLRKRSIFLKKGAQIFSFARGAGDSSYAPGFLGPPNFEARHMSWSGVWSEIKFWRGVQIQRVDNSPALTNFRTKRIKILLSCLPPAQIFF